MALQLRKGHTSSFIKMVATSFAVLALIAQPLVALNLPAAFATGTNTVTVRGNTAAGENQPGWMFNRDTGNATPTTFGVGNASTGTGSAYVQPLSSTVGAKKFIGEYFTNTQIADINSASVDFKIGAAGTASQAGQFYLNVYANYAGSAANKYYDCKYDVVASVGSTSSYTTLTFDPTQNYPVTKATQSWNTPHPASCPSKPSDMGAGAFVRMIAINMGDTSLSDAGLDGYFDNFVFNTDSAVTAYDFEGPDTSAFTYVGSPKYIRENNAGDESARILVSSAATAARFFIDGSSTPVGGNFVGPSTSTTEWWKLETPLAAGQHTITSQVEIGGEWYDVPGAGVVYSLDLPWAQYILPQAGQYFRANDKVVRIKADDEFNQFNRMVTVINGFTYTVNRTDCNDQGAYVLCDLQNLNLPEGTHIAKTTTYTKANNRADNLISQSFTIDNTRPALTGFHITNSASVYSDHINVVANATDHSGIKNVSFYLTAPRASDGVCDGNGAKLFATTDTTSAYTGTIDTSLLNGEYCLNAVAEDLAANHSNPISTIKVSIDNTAPSVPTLLSPSDNAFLNGASITQRWSGNPADTDISQFIYESCNDALCNSHRWGNGANGGEGVYAASQTSKTATNVGTAVYWWRVKAVDHAGNISGWSPIWKITVDNTPPPAPTATFMPNANGTQAVTLSDTEAGVSYRYTTDGTDPRTSSTAQNGTTFNITPAVAPAVLTIKAIAVDAAGNVSSVYTVAGPSITNQASQTATTSAITLVWTTGTPATSRVVYDTVPHAVLGSDANYGYAFSTVEDTTKTTNHSVTITGLTPGTTYYFRIVSHGSPTTVSPEITSLTLDEQLTQQNGGRPTFRVNPPQTNPVVAVAQTGDQAVLGDETITGNNTQNTPSADNTNDDKDVKGAEDVKNSDTTSPLGVAWYWWVLALAAVATGLWWLIAARRRRKDEE